MNIKIIKEILAQKINNETDLLEILLQHSIKITKSSAGKINLKTQINRQSNSLSIGDLDSPSLIKVIFNLKSEKYFYGHMELYCFQTIDHNLQLEVELLIEIVLEKIQTLRLKQDLKKSQRVFKLTFEQVGSGLCQTDLEGVIWDANRKFCELLGYSHKEIVGLKIPELTYPEDLKLNAIYKADLLNRKIPYFSMEKRYIRKDGQLIWVYITVTLMSGDDFDRDFLIGIVQDISKQKEAEKILIQHNMALEALVEKRTQELERLNKELDKASKRDPLTNLYNRRYLLEKLNESTERFRRKEETFTIALMDIDFFKSINDQLGHDCGDETLISLSKIILNEIRTLDILGRWGGEEFLLLLPDTDIFTACRISERIRKCVESYNFKYGDVEYKVTITIGMCEYSEKISIKEMIKLADQALYSGKSQGRNCIARPRETLA